MLINKKKKGFCQQVDFLVPADYRIRINKNKKVDK